LRDRNDVGSTRRIKPPWERLGDAGLAWTTVPTRQKKLMNSSYLNVPSFVNEADIQISAAGKAAPTPGGAELSSAERSRRVISRGGARVLRFCAARSRPSLKHARYAGPFRGCGSSTARGQWSEEAIAERDGPVPRLRIEDRSANICGNALAADDPHEKTVPNPSVR
jgi:hypothetical protein